MDCHYITHASPLMRKHFFNQNKSELLFDAFCTVVTGVINVLI